MGNDREPQSGKIDQRSEKADDPRTSDPRLATARNSGAAVTDPVQAKGEGQPSRVLAIRRVVSTGDDDVDMDIADIQLAPNPSPSPTWTALASIQRTSNARTNPN